MNNCYFVESWRVACKKAKVITCCFWRRPKYTRRVLDALRNCPGIHEYTLLIQQDGDDGRGDIGQSEVRRICERINFAPFQIVSESEHLGCNHNTRRALAAGFRHSDYVIHIEDDVQLAPDALGYFEWARRFESDPSVFIASAQRHPNGWLPSAVIPKPANEDVLVNMTPDLFIWGFATWRDRWNEMDRNWTKERNDQVDSWDMYLKINVRGNRVSLTPHISRSLNIGFDDGTHCGGESLSYWAGSPNFSSNGNYQRV